MPRFTYPVRGSASEPVQGDDLAFNAFASKVRIDLDGIFRDYEIADKATMRSLLQAKIDLQYVAREYQAALSTIDLLPRSRLSAGYL